ncbi:MAG: RpiB/LacA/LacB family sugar-phosphate isomerase [Candidatus Dependentiae bacterium]
MKIAIGSDHRGFEQKNIILAYFAESADHQLIDVGTESDERTDYPPFAQKVVHLMQKGEVQAGILLCGSGIGMAIAANRYPSIFAGVVWNRTIARLAREHDNVNVLVLPSDFIANDEVIPIVNAWLQASFFGGQYEMRLKMIDE